ncbi:hypothetical protein [Chamaesiphon sp. OTE_20_metabat_361]|nr:hypothetical protein [Chamaesiphon sp. OTE_20_metabat_361]
MSTNSGLASCEPKLVEAKDNASAVNDETNIITLDTSSTKLLFDF